MAIEERISGLSAEELAALDETVRRVVKAEADERKSERKRKKSKSAKPKKSERH